MKRNVCYFAVNFIIIIILPACATTAMKMYSGLQLPVDKVATLKRWNSEGSLVTLRYLCVRGIDGKKAGTETRRIDRYEILPGPHKVKIGLHRINRTDFGWDGEGEVEFNAEAGHVYEITYTEEGENIILSVIDVTG